MSNLRNAVGFMYIGAIATACVYLGHATVTQHAAQATPVPAQWVALLGVGGVENISSQISPDGKWIAKIGDQGNNSAIEIASSADIRDKSTFVSNPTTGQYLLLGPWSPNSSAIVVLGADQGREGCPYKRVLIFPVSLPTTNSEPLVFEPYLGDQDYCINVAWSPDSSMLAVGLRRDEFFILNSSGQVIRKVTLGLNASSYLAALVWTKFALFYSVIDVQNLAQPAYALYRTDPLNSTELPLAHVSNSAFEVVGSDSNTERILLISHIPGQQKKSFVLQVLNVETGRTERNLEIPGGYCASANAPDQPYTALKVAEADQPCGGTADLWIFDWNKVQANKSDRILSLLDWRPDLQGFVTIQGKTSSDMYLVVSRP